MGDLLRLRDAHEEVQLLLPWRRTGTLDAREAALCDAHLEECAECRADLGSNSALRDHYAAIPVAGPAGVPESIARAATLSRRPRKPFLERQVSLAWALAAQAAAAAAAVLLVLTNSPSAPVADHRLLGSEAPDRTGNAIVLFSPEIEEGDLRAMLQKVGARVVDGPTASGAYVLRLEPARRLAALDSFRSDKRVLLAEPIDVGTGP